MQDAFIDFFKNVGCIINPNSHLPNYTNKKYNFQVIFKTEVIFGGP